MTGWHEGPLLCLDYETTGLDPLTCRPVTVSTVLDENDSETLFHEIVNAGVGVPAEAAAIHGITTEQVEQEGIPAEEAIRTVLRALLDAYNRRVPVCIYNARYDWPLLHAEAERFGLTGQIPDVSIIDPFVIDRHMDKYRKGRRTLSAVCAEYGVTLTDAHTALADARAAGLVARKLAERYESLQRRTPRELHQLQVRWFDAWRTEYNEWLSGRSDNPDLVEGVWPR